MCHFNGPEEDVEAIAWYVVNRILVWVDYDNAVNARCLHKIDGRAIGIATIG